MIACNKFWNYLKLKLPAHLKGDSVDRLAAYENTGLEPQEIKQIVELFHFYRHICGETPPDRLRELVEADRKGRVEILTGDSREMDTIRDLVQIITWVTDSVQDHDFSPFRAVRGAVDVTFPVVKEWDKVIEKHSEIIYLAFKDLETKFTLKGDRDENQT